MRLQLEITMTHGGHSSTATSLIRRLSAMGPVAAAVADKGDDGWLQRDVLARAHAISSGDFERLVLDLLVAMGYGTRTLHLGRSGDGGLDGMIARDMLGLEAVYFQAKRYRLADTVAVSHVRDFAGSLDACRATVGVFMTTANISSASHEFARLFSRRMVLVDGAFLAELMIANGIGVRVRAVQEVREIDESYFAGRRMAETISASIQPRK